MRIRTDDVIVVCGKRRSGKTFFLQHFLLPKLPKALIWDYNFEYNLKNSVIIYDLRKLLPMVNSGKFRFVIFRPLLKTEETFYRFCDLANRLINNTIVIEEVERYATSWNIPLPLKMIVDTGRHRGLGLICTMRRTMRTHPDIIFNADYIFAFHQHRPQDLDYLAQIMNPEIVYKLPKLPLYWFIVYCDRDGETYVCRKI
jgi:hypothetical protein